MTMIMMMKMISNNFRLIFNCERAEVSSKSQFSIVKTVVVAMIIFSPLQTCSLEIFLTTFK